MRIKEITEPSGLVIGIHYHDQILTKFSTCAKKCILEISTNEGEAIYLEFSSIFSSSIRKYLPKTIILSMFLWETTNVPDWFQINSQFLDCLEDGPITSKYVFFLDSSFGASVCILFDMMRVTSYTKDDVIFEL